MAKILIIDDERSIRNTLKDILEFEKHQIVLAENGKTGLEAAQSTSFDVIFSDIKMPEMDGIELLTALKELEIEAPIVMISGHGNIETAVECIKKGAFDFIEKPIDLNRLLITVRNALDKNNLVTETKILKKKILIIVICSLAGACLLGASLYILKQNNEDNKSDYGGYDYGTRKIHSEDAGGPAIRSADRSHEIPSGDHVSTRPAGSGQRAGGAAGHNL